MLLYSAVDWAFTSQTTKFVQQLTKHLEGPLLIDADGLNNLDEETLKKRTGVAVITPHPRELSRLCGQSIKEIQDNRIATVRRLSQDWNVVLLLKGAYTVIGSPDGKIFINPTGNSALATAGSGDVLSGFIGGFSGAGAFSFKCNFNRCLPSRPCCRMLNRKN